MMRTESADSTLYKSVCPKFLLKLCLLFVSRHLLTLYLWWSWRNSAFSNSMKNNYLYHVSNFCLYYCQICSLPFGLIFLFIIVFKVLFSYVTLQFRVPFIHQSTNCTGITGVDKTHRSLQCVCSCINTSDLPLDHIYMSMHIDIYMSMHMGMLRYGIAWKLIL